MLLGHLSTKGYIAVIRFGAFCGKKASFWHRHYGTSTRGPRMSLHLSLCLFEGAGHNRARLCPSPMIPDGMIKFWRKWTVWQYGAEKNGFDYP